MTLLAMLLLAAPVAAEPAKAPAEIAAAAPASDWVTIPPEDMLVIDLVPDARGKPRRVVIQLMPKPFSQGWISNIRALAAAHWWDGTSINRVQDNYVVQWGDPYSEDKAKAKPLPAGLKKVPQKAYVARITPTSKVRVTLSPYAQTEGFYQGWPIGTRGRAAWPVHCYGMVGVGRDMPPDTGSGAELYTVIGHAPRQLDRNIALVGRVIDGIENMSSLPRGTEPLSFYRTAEERTPIVRTRIASDLPESERPRFAYLSTESASFEAYAGARTNRRDAFFIVPAGGADICNIPVPVRAAAR